MEIHFETKSSGAGSEINFYGNSTAPHPMCNLDSPPNASKPVVKIKMDRKNKVTDTPNDNLNIPSQFAPITLVRATKKLRPKVVIEGEKERDSSRMDAQCGLAKKMKKKRSEAPSFATGAAPIFEEMQMCGSFDQSQKSIEAIIAETHAIVKKKKRTRRHAGVLKKMHSPVELVPLSFQFESENAIVSYQSDGTIVSFEGPFDPVKKQKPRPKVEIDEETDRVWRLLLKDVNSQGIDGMDDEKAKWWEEERRVFQGRADSFIARMHLVQGDRRFSPWKGSVLDSVVGAFLTQNVSDHLSSSAFMSLAARYPLHSKSSTTKCNFLGVLGRGLRIDNRTIMDRYTYELKKPTQSTVNWDSLRVEAAQIRGKTRERTPNTMDSLDWEGVRCADVGDVADAIKIRGQNNRLAERIQDFLNRLAKDHGSYDLEWLRDVAPDKVKEYLLSVRGLGLKSVECVRLLTLHHVAFPVDTNVGRVAVRLGWVPLQPLPESLQLHLLELYPVLESIQRYLWPRLCKLDQRTLYELHYQLITFGKVFCTKSKPNCNVCPMRGECRHFASAFASSKLALPVPDDKTVYQNTIGTAQQLQYNNVPIIEVPTTPEPIIEVPMTPEFEEPVQIPDIEDAFWEDSDEIPTIKLNISKFTQNLQNYMHQNLGLEEGDVSKALVALSQEAASIPTPKLKDVSRLRTEHQVYELSDLHPLLEGLERREPDDPCPYLLAIWTPGETSDSIAPPERKCRSQEFGGQCNESICVSCNSIREANSQIVRGTLLIPCRTAMRGSFPLNGTYFQVNEVFADHASSLNPIDVPRAWIWNLPMRTVYFGTSIPTIFKGQSMECIQHCFWRGYVCVRGFDRKTGAPRPLVARLHFPVSKRSRKQAAPSNN